MVITSDFVMIIVRNIKNMAKKLAILNKMRIFAA